MKKLKLHQLKNISIYNLLAIITVSFVLLSSIYDFSQRFLEPKAYDFLVFLTAHKNGSKDIVTVVIDDESLNEIGRWSSWKRSYYTDMFEFLENYGKAKIIAFDSVIKSPGNAQDDQDFLKRISKLKNLIIGISFDKKITNQNELETLLKNKFSIKVQDTRAGSVIKKTEFSSFSYSSRKLFNTLNSVGSVSFPLDTDGIIRKTEPIFYYKNSYYPSLSLAVYSKLHKTRKFTIQDNDLFFSTNKKIPIYSQEGTFSYIKWYKPFQKDDLQAHKSYSAWKIIKSYEQIKKGQTPILSPEIFKDKIVVVGATALALNDFKATPFGPNYPGVDIQATCIDNILHNDFIYRPNLLIRSIILLGVVLVAFISVLLLQPVYSTIIIVLLMIGYFQVCMYSYSNNCALDIITPHAFIICCLALGYGYKYIIESNKKIQIQKVMAKYVSRDVMTNILQDIENVKLGGKRAEVTVLFADVRGFTSIAETLEPEEVSSILNLYFSEMVPIIRKNNGTLNKFMGDALLTVFGAPIPNQDHPKDAILCAMEMLHKVKELQGKWLKEGKPKIDIGIGINTGTAFVGNVGSEDRLEYTVIGDTVNLASRLDSYNKIYSTKLLISSHTYEKVKDWVDVVSITSVTVKGKSEPVDIFEVIGLLDHPKVD